MFSRFSKKTLLALSQPPLENITACIPAVRPFGRRFISLHAGRSRFSLQSFQSQRIAQLQQGPFTSTAAIFAQSSTYGTMSSDEAYAAFLDKANEDPNAGRAKTASTSNKSATTKSHQQNVPKPLVAAAQDQYYTSDSDEPFEAVAVPLEGSGGLPDEDTFLKLTGLPQSADSITILDPVDWDSRGQYKKLLDAVRKAGEGNDVRVYRVQHDSTRAEYWLVTTTGDEPGQLVGVKAKAVES